jgi:outer membrane protein assembly factor BamA
LTDDESIRSTFTQASRSYNNIVRIHGRPVAFISAIVLLLIGHSAHAQGKDRAFRLTKISVSGMQKYSEQQIIAVSGLFAGESVSLEDLSAAANRLAQYGAFQRVTYRYRTQNDEMGLEFQVVEASNLLTCRFDNFVWFTPADLDSRLSRAVPLYDGSAPPSGQMLENIQAALRKILLQKGVPGDVQFIPSSAGPGQPVTIIDFTASGVSLPIQEIHFPGASAISADILERDSKPLLGQDYTQTEVEIFVHETLLPLYGERGYLRTRFEEPTALVLGTDYAAATQNVSVTMAVHEGIAYNWNGEEWSGNHLFPSAELDKLLGMRLQAPANMAKYDQGLKNIAEAYGKQGYLLLVISPHKRLDDATRRANYLFSVEEGPQFHMGRLTINAPSARATRRLLKEWKLRLGDVFDESYVNQFMKNALTDLHSSEKQIANTRIAIHPDPNTDTVNVEINFQ